MAENIAQWLKGIGLGRFAGVFSDNGIDLGLVPELTEYDLKELGLNIGERRRLQRAVRSLSSETGPASQVGRQVGTAETAHDAERRQLTVLFSDMVGSTALAEKLDPEEMRDLIRFYQDTVSTEITRFAGHVAKFMGDGVLAYFGWPNAHEDDAERAVLSGLAITEAARRLSTFVGEPIQVRVGVATGLVVVGDLIGEGTATEELVIGTAPNLAARLQDMAAGNTVVIADSTRELLGERFVYENLGLHRLRGLSEPVRVWRLVGPVGTESRFEATRGPHLTPLMGRSEELDLLSRRWAVVKEGGGQVVLLEGEAGIGKSRIVHTLHEQISADPNVRLFYQCSPHHSHSALYPFIRQLERAAQFERGDSGEQKLNKLEALLAQSTGEVGDVTGLIASLLSINAGARYPPLSVSPQQQKERTLRVLLEQLEGLAARKPVLVVFEDIHWIDPTSQELLDMLVDRVKGIPVLALITFRPEYVPPWFGQPGVTLLALNRLTHEMGAAMVRELSNRKELPAEVLEQIVVKSDGIPLFVEELTKSVLGSGLLEEKVDRYAVVGPLPEHAIPTSLMDSLMARLDQLAHAKEVAQIGAVIGREFSHDLLAEVSTLSDDDLNQALDRLRQSELIFSRGVPPNARYLFKHALVQDAAYESLLKSRRQRLHSRIAQILEDRFSERVEVEPELLAHHYTEAGLTHEAVPYWQRAGKRAVALSAHVEAIGHLNSGLAIIQSLPDGPARTRYELALQCALGPPLIATRGYGATEVMKAYTRARQLWQQVGNAAQLCPILYGLWTCHSTRAEHQTAKTLCRDLLNAAESTRDEASLLDAHVAWSITSFFTGQFSLAKEHADRGITLYNPELHRFHALQNPGVVCRIISATASWFLGYPQQALTECHETLGLARELSHPFSLAVALTWIAMLYQYNRDAPKAQTLAEEAMAISGELTFPNWLSVAGMVKGWAMAEQGNHGESSDQLHESIVLARAIETRIWQPYGLYLLGEANEKAGMVDKALTLAKDTREQYWEAELHRQKGVLLLADSKYDAVEAEACFKEAINVSRRQRAKSLELRAATSLGRIWQRQGRQSKARDLLAPVYDWFSEGFETADLKDAKVLLDELS